MQLTWEETRNVLRDAMLLEPEDLRKSLADHVPQGVMERLMVEMWDYFTKRFGDEEVGFALTSAFMMGFHSSWHLAVKAMKDET